MESPLNRRIRQLEADNASLASAASQAATMAEQYARNAAALRQEAATHSADAALVTELTDATRRKDRRIQRLGTLLATEKERVARLEGRVAELEELKEIAEKMEETLTASVLALQRAREAGSGGGGGAEAAGGRGVGAAAYRRVHDFRRGAGDDSMEMTEFVIGAVRCYFQDLDEAAKDVDAFEVVRSAASVMQGVGVVIAKLSQGTGGNFPEDSVDFLQSVADCAEGVVSWCYENVDDVGYRASGVVETMSSLAERMRTLQYDVANANDASTWSPEFARMKMDLIRMALQTLMAECPEARGLARGLSIGNLCANVKVVAQSRAKNVGSALKIHRGVAEGVLDKAELESKLAVAKATLERKTTELDDLRVRVKVFEERLVAKLDDERTIDLLNQKVEALQDEINDLKRDAGSSSAKQAPHEEILSTKALHAESETAGEAFGVGSSGNSSFSPKTPPCRNHLHVVDIAKVSARLRKTILHRQLADLRDSPYLTATAHRPPVLGDAADTLEVHEAVRVALDSAREAASNASVLSLDEDTLAAKTNGMTMSRKVPLQAMSAAFNHRFEAVTKGPECALRRDIHIAMNGNDLVSVARQFRQMIHP